MNYKLFGGFIVLVMIGSLMVSSSCKQSNDLTLIVSQAQWELAHSNTSGDTVRLHLAGFTNGEKVTVETYGDGLKSNLELTLGENKVFSDVVPIAFSHQPYSTPVKFHTVLTAYRNGESTTVNIASENLY